MTQKNSKNLTVNAVTTVILHITLCKQTLYSIAYALSNNIIVNTIEKMYGRNKNRQYDFVMADCRFV